MQNFFLLYIEKLLHFADLFDIVIVACGSDSVVECHLAKVKVAGPNPVSRSTSSLAQDISEDDDDRLKRNRCRDMRP